MSELVKFLSEGSHDVEIKLAPENTVPALKECLDAGYVHVRFPNTRGGTTLGLRVDADRTDLSEADFGSGSGQVAITGLLTLDYVPVSCHARIDLATLKGTGHLEVRPA